MFRFLSKLENSYLPKIWILPLHLLTILYNTFVIGNCVWNSGVFILNGINYVKYYGMCTSCHCHVQFSLELHNEPLSDLDFLRCNKNKAYDRSKMNNF